MKERLKTFFLGLLTLIVVLIFCYWLVIILYGKEGMR